MNSFTRSLSLLALGSLALGVLHTPLMAEEARELAWKDLVPEGQVHRDPMENLSDHERDVVGYVIHSLETLPPRSPETEQFYKGLDDEILQLEGLDIDVDVIQGYYDAMQAAVVEELDGQLIRLPGYVLPLEYDEDKVTEFLLVPYAGACIHVPPPPPNQIVHVKLDPSEGFEPEGLFDPVWVTGRIEARAMTEDLFLVDGSADVDISYAMEAGSVEPYKE